ncbi:MAG: amidase [Limnohabitans sp.]|nr:amidase [Limnohabitans sp.]
METIRQLQLQLKKRQLTSCSLIEKSLSQAKNSLYVMTSINAEHAMSLAQHADSLIASGHTNSPLLGLPITIKDLFDVQGQTTMAGTVVCAGEPSAAKDALVISRLKNVGAVILGKTNMSEFAFSGVGINPHYGTPVNPCDLQIARIPGGSSSGAAVSVASGFAVAGLGSDTGGSLRIPAALCGLVGFKNSQFRVPREGAVELARSLDTVGAITRCVDDAMILDQVLSGQDLLVQARGLKGLRLAIPTTLMIDDLDETVAKSFSKVISTLTQAGVEIREISLKELDEIAQINQPGGLSPIEGYAAQGVRIEADPTKVDHRVVQRMYLGKGVSAADYLHLLDRRKNWIKRVQSVIEPFDAIICPTVPIIAQPIQALLDSEDEFFRVNRLLLRNTFAINFLDGCSISIPCHAQGDLPVGLMISANCGKDSAVLGIALAIEAQLKKLHTN